MIAIAWAATVLCLITVYVIGLTDISLATAILAIIAFAFFLIACWGFGAFHIVPFTLIGASIAFVFTAIWRIVIADRAHRAHHDRSSVELAGQKKQDPLEWALGPELSTLDRRDGVGTRKASK